jgi:hypothetical protein
MFLIARTGIMPWIDPTPPDLQAALATTLASPAVKAFIFNPHAKFRHVEWNCIDVYCVKCHGAPTMTKER